MSTPNPNIVVAVGGVIVAVAVFVAWCASEGEDPAAPEQLEAAAPMDAPDAFAEADIEEHILVELDDTPVWRAKGDVVFEGPVVDGVEMSWQLAGHDGWTVLVGDGQGGGIDAEVRVWTAPGFPHAIVDVDATVSPEAAGQPLGASASVHADDAEWLDGSLQREGGVDKMEGADVSAARFATPGGQLQVHAAGAKATASVDGGPVGLNWPLWPGIKDEDFEECIDQGELPERSVSRRMMVSFGEQPVVAPLAIPYDALSLSTPIFVDAPEQSDDAWADGRARDAQDLSRRFRALAFGHSDREDPRYGNGGLLAAEMGAVFVVPNQWWDEPEIEELRASLEGTRIEVIADDDADIETGQGATVVGDADFCAAVAEVMGGEAARVVVRTDDDVPHRQDLTAAIPPVIRAGTSPLPRQELLNRVFEPEHPYGLFAPGEYRAGFVPLVATRNPLEPSAEDKLLSPDSQGHWTLHDDLTRQFTRLELDPDSMDHRMVSFADLADRRRRAGGLAYFEPDGRLQMVGEVDELVFFGAVDAFDLPVRGDGAVATWSREVGDPPQLEESTGGVMVEFGEE